jgi:hypothetical protein
VRSSAAGRSCVQVLEPTRTVALALVMVRELAFAAAFVARRRS